MPGGGEIGKDEVSKAPCVTTTTAACPPAASNGLGKAHIMGTKHGWGRGGQWVGGFGPGMSHLDSRKEGRQGLQQGALTFFV